jgi:guanine nucleotide-binding protein subunit alpha
LNDLDRVTDRNYTVTDDDVVRARLRTLGIQEHMITFKEGLLDKGMSSSPMPRLKFDQPAT